MCCEMAFDLSLEFRHGFAACHQVGDLFAGPFALAEIGGNRATDQHRKMVADGHRMCHLMGDKDHSEATSTCLQHDPQDVRRFLDAKCRGRLIKDQYAWLRSVRPGRLPAIGARHPTDRRSAGRRHRCG